MPVVEELRSAWIDATDPTSGGVARERALVEGRAVGDLGALVGVDRHPEEQREVQLLLQVAARVLDQLAGTAVEHELVPARGLPVGGPEDLSYRDAYARIARVTGRRVTVIGIPQLFLTIGGLLAAPLLPELRGFFAFFAFFGEIGRAPLCPLVSSCLVPHD